MNGEANENGSSQQTPALAKKKLTLSFEDYKNLSNMLVLHMRSEESRFEGETVERDCGTRRSDLVTWYLEQVADQIDSEDELIERKTLIEKVIDRLRTHDEVLLDLRTLSGLKTKTTTDQLAIDDDPFLVVHPNYIIE